MKLDLYLKRLQLLFYIFFVTGMIVLAIYGGYKNFHSVPFWDSWNSNLNFYIEFQNGNYSSLWNLHNEHRIIFSKIFFLIDHYFFGGLSLFLIILNYLLIIFSILIFKYLIKNIAVNRIYEKNITTLITAGILFSWVQSENITWTFQSMFFLAQSLPLLSLCILARYFYENRTYLFYLALLLAVFSAGTMANGLILLPLFTFYVLYKEKNTKKILITIGTTFFTIYLYFLNYQTNKNHGKLSETLFNNTYDYIKYFLIYLGNPFGKIFANFNSNYTMEYIFSIVFLLTLSLLIVKAIKDKDKENYFFDIVIIYIIFILATDFITAGGRVIFGLAQATSSRYTTPVLMAWCALIIISYFCTLDFKKYIKQILSILMIFICGFILLFQYKNIKINTNIKTTTNLISLALSIGVKDDEKILQIYPSVTTIYNISEKSIERDLTFFGHYPYKGLRTELKTSFNNIQNIRCDAAVIEIKKIPSDTNFLAIKAWIMYSNQYQPEIIRLLDKDNKIIGFAQPEIIGRSFLRTSFNQNPTQINGYIFANAMGQKIKAVGDTSSCFAELLVQ